MPMGLCAAAPRRSHLAASLRRMIRTAFMPLFAAALLSACGGGGDDDDFDLVSAYQVLGQSGFSGASANQGNGNADADATPFTYAYRRCAFVSVPPQS